MSRDYRQAYADALPNGAAWAAKDDPESTLYKLIHGLSDELSRVDSRVTDLLDEADPRTASETLPEWASVLNCDEADVYPTYIQSHDQREEYYISLIGACGAQSEYVYAVHYEPMTCRAYCNAVLYAPPWRSVVTFTASGFTGYEDVDLIATLINTSKQLHVVVLYDLTIPEV
jgi:uncharacterized protein YmfQ (DUF2313 family)